MRIRVRTSCCMRTERRARPRIGITRNWSARSRVRPDFSTHGEKAFRAPRVPRPVPGITDVHVHVEPYRTLKPAIFKMLWPEVPEREKASRLIDDPRTFLGHLDTTGVKRACLINYVAPEVMGFTEDVNRFVGEFAREDRKRLIPFGSVHPKRTKHAKGDVERLAAKGEMGGLKNH